MNIAVKKTKKIKAVAIVAGLFIYSYFFYLMITITAQYFPIRTDVAFLNIKQDYVHMPHYLLAFFIHVFSSCFVLLAGFTQFSKYIRMEFPKVHKRMGWVYVIVTVGLAGPSGLIIGIYANGGLSSQIAFCMLAVLWIVFTMISVVRIIQKKVTSHRIWMIRSFALALSAITLRAWKYLLVAMFHPKPMDVYQVVAWLGWVLNLVIAEIIIYKTIIHASKKTVK
jgi:hypothetical protein